MSLHRQSLVVTKHNELNNGSIRNDSDETSEILSFSGNNGGEISDNERDEDLDNSEETDSMALTNLAAKWILQTSEARELSRSSMMGIVGDVSEFLETVLLICQSRVDNVLRMNSINPTDTIGLDTAFSVNPFDGLETFHNLKKCISIL